MGGLDCLRTASPGDVESEITSLWRRGNIWICTERELAVDTSPNEDENHCAEQLCRGLPDILSVSSYVSIKTTMVLWRCMLTLFLPTGLDVAFETSLDLYRRFRMGALALRPCES